MNAIRRGFLVLLGMAIAAASGAPAGKAIDDGTKRTTTSRYWEWKHAGGDEFKPGLTFPNGEPVLMLFAPAEESPAQLKRRCQAMVSACGFLLADDAAPSAWICVVGIGPKGTGSQLVTRHQVVRDEFQQAIRKSAKTGDLASALRKAHDDDAVLRTIAATLRLN